MNDNGGSAFGLLGLIFILLIATGGLHECQNTSDEKESVKHYCATHDCSDFAR